VSSDLFALLPAVYRLRDAQIAQSQGLAQGPLESLLMVIDEQVAIVADDLTQLYEDQFIETCAQWVIPYIGDLIGYQSVRGIAPAIDNPRAEVAQTISLRRRKGTVLVLEQLARDTTGWGAHAVEFFQVLGDTQYMNHVRPRNYYVPDLRRWQSGLYLDSAFDRTSHRVDVRRISSGRGRYNIQNVGVFLWSLGVYGITDAPVTPAATNTAGGAQCYRFSPLGMDMPLFHRAVSQGEQIYAAATPVNVAARLRRRVLCADLITGVGAQFYGPAGSLLLTLDGTVVNPYQIKVANLSGPDGAWVNLPADSTYAVVVDPELGRLALPPPGAGAPAPQLNATYYYGFNADMGGGDYPRAASFVVDDGAQVLRFPDTAAPPRYLTLPDAVTHALGQLANAGTGEIAVELANSDPQPIADLTVDLPEGKTLEIRAADGARPTIQLGGEIAVSGDASSQMVLNGLVVAAATGMAPGSLALVHLPASRPDGTANQLSGLSLTDCTLVPGWSVSPDGQPEHGSDPVLIAEPTDVTVTITRSILGAIRANALATVAVSDSIIDATDRTQIAYAAVDVDEVSGGAALTLSGCTVVGKVHATLLSLVSDSIVWAALAAADTWAAGLVADRKQEGCVRFSFLPYGSVTPRRFECVEQALAGPQPLFRSPRYGDPGYLKLLAATDDVIRRGADDAGEMGAFHFVLAPQRETDLKTRLQEYIPVGLEYGLIYQD
jgi:hypothetical protein